LDGRTALTQLEDYTETASVRDIALQLGEEKKNLSTFLEPATFLRMKLCAVIFVEVVVK